MKHSKSRSQVQPKPNRPSSKALQRKRSTQGTAAHSHLPSSSFAGLFVPTPIQPGSNVTRGRCIQKPWKKIAGPPRFFFFWHELATNHQGHSWVRPSAHGADSIRLWAAPMRFFHYSPYANGLFRTIFVFLYLYHYCTVVGYLCLLRVTPVNPKGLAFEQFSSTFRATTNPARKLGSSLRVGLFRVLSFTSCCPAAAVRARSTGYREQYRAKFFNVLNVG